MLLFICISSEVIWCRCHGIYIFVNISLHDVRQNRNEKLIFHELGSYEQGSMWLSSLMGLLRVYTQFLRVTWDLVLDVEGAKALYHKTYNVGLRKYNCFGWYSDSEEDTSLDILTILNMKYYWYNTNIFLIVTL